MVGHHRPDRAGSLKSEFLLDLLTIGLMLFAAFLHASWHSLVKYGGDQRLVLMGMGVVATIAALCVIPFLPLPAVDVWPVIAASVTLHVAYKFALAESYAVGDLSQAYPLARGFVPLFSTTIAFLFLSQVPAVSQTIGIAVVSCGLLWLAGHSLRRGFGWWQILAALITGLMVSAYSVVDAYGARLAGNWASFTAWLVVVDSVVFALLVSAKAGWGIWHVVWRERNQMLVSGVLGVTSFSIFIWALSRNAVGPILALRESSVLIATTIGIVLHRESISRHKIIGATLIAAGLIIIAVVR